MDRPERLGKYQVTDVLGKGAMGVVYKGFDPHIERPVAIKTIRKDMVDAELAAQFMGRFRNEARAAGRLHHPNIVGVYEYGEEGAVAYIAMEYVEGAGLREYLNRRASFDFGELVALMAQLLSALEFAHARGVIHRDIKPSNLIVAADGTLKVADFGIARIDTSNLTSVGMVIGTPSYMSPEQCMGEVVDARSDLWSAGVVLYELLTGEKPFRGTVDAIGYKIVHEDPAPPTTLSSLKLPAAVDRLVATALEKQPAARFQDARAFQAALRDIAKLDVEVADGQGTTLINIGQLKLHQPAASWDDATLNTAEHELARFLGPMAKIVVRRAAEKTHDRAELCSILGANIDDLDSRRKFVEAFSRSASGQRTGGAAGGTGGGVAVSGTHGKVTTTSSPTEVRPRTGATGSGISTSSSPGVPPLDPAYVEEITARLAVHLGPIARIVAKKAAQKAATRIEFVRFVADSLGTQDRAAFLREVGVADG